MQKETLATHFGYNSKDGHGTMAVPIYQSTAYDFGSCETAANRFALKELGQIYSRLTNPTLDVFEARIAALEGAKAAISTSSGQAAIFYSIANLAEAGDNIIVAQKIYGGATTLLTHTIKRFGIKAKIFDSDSADDLEALIDDKTKAIFFETLSNPQIAISNVEKIVQIANRHNIVTVADNTVATPILFNPLKKGVDVVVHSASKYISGQGLSVAGAIASRDGLNDKLVSNPRYAHFNTPDESYHGLVYSNLAGMFDLFTLRIRLSLLRDIGATLSAFNAFQLIQGLETLSIRIKEHSKNALKVAEFLEKHPKVKSVNYPGLASSKLNSYVKANFTDGLASGLLSFDVGDAKTAAKILNNVKIFSVVVNIGDSKSIITHPASTTHQQLSKKELEDAGVSEGLIRLSIGLENADDLINDLKEAMQ
ncbi:O-acetylhomoserine aminocarboxypropyltransferase/cysteine synthase family protein [Campylobacter fetus]|uniref:O-acetylhomoserine aminocarboxypropyltransferase n=3 Tax=Campylobacter fetus TaxID=196 RepID=A0AAX0HBI3_CAMFE|nr:aminotransferase class I/II-fold pyridoxal phosphate-dependent enzyme [Campylobacter fetus]AGZ81776.1 O-acetylhomoserine sulfhydrylase [Campylobacter fetus subsp. testudinum 03-427]AJB45508.1 O-acetylhomoserine aminocarboxypropyltransferase [Campylobacter fetus subsp. testudinum]ALV64932.1 O-acetylhomoserine sulfhydrylase [Campylobacter fetus subsp. testudinum Sp3]EAI4321248.1 O-acetylhomoserine aminocarboxypropyltransferase/cysteine synthase [Campylobacter fetus]EAI4390505.1 O-acetylhomose